VTAWLLLAVPVVAAALAFWSLLGTAMLLVIGFGTTSALLVGVATTPGGLTSIRDRGVLGPAFGAAARWTLIEVAVAVVTIQLPLVGLLVVLAVVGTSPWALRRVSRRRRRTSPRPAEAWRHSSEVADLSPERIRALVRRLDIAGLCGAWRSSHALLDQSHDVETRSKVVLLRQEYLDEMERRDAPGFQRWLEADAQASGDPEGFLRSSGGEAAA
jgi:hypothetical protein